MYLNVFSLRVTTWILLWWQWDTVSLTPPMGLCHCVGGIVLKASCFSCVGYVVLIVTSAASLYLKCWESHQFPEATAMSGAVLSPMNITCHVPFLASCIKVLIRFETYRVTGFRTSSEGPSGSSQKLWTCDHVTFFHSSPVAFSGWPWSYSTASDTQSGIQNLPTRV